MEELNLKYLVQQILAKFYIVLIVLVLTVLAGEIYTFKFQTPLYGSTTQLVLTHEAESNNSLTVNDVTLSNNLVTTYSEIVTSRDVLTKVIENLKLDTQTPETLKAKITVSSTKSTQLITVKVVDPEAGAAQAIAAELAEVFKAEIEELYKIDNVQIVDHASYSEDPVNVDVIKQTAMYVLIGLALGLGLVIAITYLDTTIKSTETVEEELGLTVLGVIPNMKRNK